MHKPSYRSPQREHNQFGIENWFRIKYGITNQQEIRNFIQIFCEKHDFKDGKLQRKINFCANRFSEFAPFIGAYIKNIETIFKEQ